MKRVILFLLMAFLLASCGQAEAAQSVESNAEHMAKLVEGVDAWNQWRIDNPKVVPALRDAELPQTNLSGYDLSRAVLSLANLAGANLNGADLTNANLRAADLTNADLTNAILTGTRYDSRTIWPAGFDPVAAGARDVGQ